MSHTLPPCTSLCALLIGSAAMAQDFVLTTPGTATWEVQGSQTIFTIHEDSVFNWGGMNLGPSESLIFDFVGGDTVTNFIDGAGTHVIAGDVMGNGNLGFFSPSGDLIVSGSITADSVTVSTLNVDPTDFADGGGFSLFGGEGSRLSVLRGGRIHASSGDVLLASEQVQVLNGASVTARDRVMIGGGTDLNTVEPGERKLSQNSEQGVINSYGFISAPSIELIAGKEVLNKGVIGEGSARVFIEVGADGRIISEEQGSISTNRVLIGFFEANAGILRRDGDNAGAISEGSVTLPALTRPDGSKIVSRQTVSVSSPMTASTDPTRDGRRAEGRTIARRERKGSSLMMRGSFFGSRGASAATAEKKDKKKP